MFENPLQHVTETRGESHDETSETAVIRENWPYRDFSFEEWGERGMLTTKEGVPSKLNREQYQLVRSEEFKVWFGDWEDKGRENVSVFVDKDTGEPQVFYRGDKSLFKEGFLIKSEEERTLNGIEANDYSAALPIAGARNQGVFFTNDREVALDYGMDKDSVTLSKYGIEQERDHPKTFPKLVSFLKSVTETNNGVWRKIIRYHYGGLGRTEAAIERDFRKSLSGKLNEQEIDELLDAEKSLVDAGGVSIRPYGLG